MKSVAIKYPTLSPLERKAHRKHRKAKRKGEPYPLDNQRKGGAKKSKRKGANFEATIAKSFSTYFGCSVRRTPGSGGWATVGEFGPRGDLVFSNHKAPYHVECKKHEGWDLSDLITGLRARDKTVTNSIDKWWDQCIGDCPKKKVPMLVFARNVARASKGRNIGVPPLLMMRQTDFQKLGTAYKKISRIDARAPVDEISDGSLDAWGEKVAVWCASDFIPHFTITDEAKETRIVCTLSNFFKFVRPPKASPRRKKWIRGVG